MSEGDDGDEKMSKAERIRVGGHSAPVLRRATRSRRINLVSEDGTVVGSIDSVALALKMHERVGIEFDVEPGRREQVRTCRCGATFMLPPKRDWKDRPGRLPLRCPACREAAKSCRVCGSPSTSAARKRGMPERSYCARHVPTGIACVRDVPPCVVCGAPAHSPAKARFAVSKGKPVYCEDHRGGEPLPPPTRRACEVCGVEIKGARWCSKCRNAARVKPRLPCAVCGSPSDRTYVRKDCAAYCTEHRGGVGLGRFESGSNARRAKKSPPETKKEEP